ncbi:MAG: hypothetical protein COT24_03395 [Candidatus Kerfeldbacteria bacterium CG08_land_8_20_14_0_20_40_16]|uniref:SHS2 domain-containing protein n=1 Tax=Candidatus Kerfeldbacteria bacterium CG08_land_8_20_14_0_20_40_16 TaxID=2014244 RepID=A0A2H0YVE9_9BACT|nr:MAG: hypothetical protein COT24_03395 [Candidatus Kerfeldbacteria bacterium CG08_land_8_20_14_0_20_40_16]
MFGLDISDRTLRAVSLTRKGKMISVNSINEITLPAGLIEGGEILKSDALVPYLKKLLQDAKPHKIKGKDTIACLPEHQSFIKVIQVPKKNGQLQPSLIKSEVANHIPFPIEEMYLDWQIIKEQAGPNAKKLNVLVGAAPKNIVDVYQETLKKANLVPIILEIESIAIARSLVSFDLKNSNVGSLIIDFGLDRTSFIIFDKNLIQFTSGITTISGNRMTDVISKNLSLSQAEGEKAKKLAGLDPRIGKGKVALALQQVVDDLLSKIREIISFYKEHYPGGNQINKIILAGGGSNLKLLDRVLFQSLKITTQRGDSLTNLGKKNITFLTGKNQSSFATAIGLALKAIKNDYP